MCVTILWSSRQSSPSTATDGTTFADRRPPLGRHDSATEFDSFVLLCQAGLSVH
jgi:hypothetical protein